ncbi:ABC transporter permease [Saccharibacillus sp. CPCC 101409]|uniref:YhgE/Pip domain-containing protein n=1 Tax=Saccharibacillus sp. CPCC 101409 TaxID=3058041 RepID=UPI0026737269|nr:ABC transporter permease [Saccharibacillus sp. CPCC 101409]MDO3408217.1 ABC transporter permease [Saccharibacillus sp. CPCC 101409]
MKKAFKSLMGITQTRIGIVFALFVPLLFVLVWMTGYHDATQRIDQLRVAVVNLDGEAGRPAAERIAASAPFQTETVESEALAHARMDAGRYAMVAVIPPGFEEDVRTGRGKLVYTINQGTSEVAAAMMEGAAERLSEGLSQAVSGAETAGTSAVGAEIVKTHEQSNFAVTMLPMILGFIPYIAMMTMNIQFNISSQILKRGHGKWNIFWSRQILLALVALGAPLPVIGLARLFAEPAASFGSMWLLLVCVFLASICVTQMSFALLGSAAPLFNVALVPLQLMTAGNIVPSSMLAPFYRHFGSFLPAPNGIQGFMRLIYNGEGAGTFMLHLLLIAAVTWGITLLRTGLQKPAVSPAAGATAAAAAAH